jgi:hypothetical protein
MNWRADVRHHLFELGAPLLERRFAQVLISEREQIPRDE